MAANRAIIPHLRERSAGTIINVTSSAGIAPMPLVAAYTASKYAIEGFSESLAYELGGFGVRVKIVEPGLAPTTSFAGNSGGRCDNRIQAAYADYAGKFMRSMAEYPTAYTTVADAAEAVLCGGDGWNGSAALSRGSGQRDVGGVASVAAGRCIHQAHTRDLRDAMLAIRRFSRSRMPRRGIPIGGGFGEASR